MPGGRPPKYLNTSDGLVFRKSDILYGLDQARKAIAQSGSAIVVEGYTDVIMLRQSGVERVVASMGTALTESQVGELRRLCGTVYLAFDADAAGQEASLRGMEIARAKGLNVRVVRLPDGQDPADAAAAGADAFESALAAAVPYLTYRVELALDSGGSRDDRYARARELLRQAPPSVERDDLVRTVADRLELSDDLTARLTTTAPAGPAAPRQAAPALRLSPRGAGRTAVPGAVSGVPGAGP